MNKLIYLLLIVLCWSCKQSTNTEKYIYNRDNIIDVTKYVKEITIEDITIGSIARLYLIGDYLIITDIRSHDKLIHLFDKNEFKYITSTTYRGQGPGEIANLGHIGINEAEGIFYASDHGKQRIFSYDLDSVLSNPFYAPGEKMKMEESLFPDRYQYINDSLCVGLIIEPIENYDFKPSVAKWNMNTASIYPMKYEHPEIKKKRINFAASVENNSYVECYSHHDLMTICDLEGNLKYNIYGRKWNNRVTNEFRFYGNVEFCADKIIALYCDGEDNFGEAKNGEIKPNFPTKFIIFDLNGDYIQTLEVGYQITHFCYDKKKNRIIMTLDDDIQFAYLDLDGIIK